MEMIGVLEYVAGPVNLDWKKLIIADPHEDEIGAGHLHVVAGLLGLNNLPLVVKCEDPDCEHHAVIVNPDDGDVINN